MTAPYREHPEATAELVDAARWYDSQQFGLGDEFLSLVDEAVLDACTLPGTWPCYPGWDDEPVVRARRVRKYPYRVLYYVEDGEVVVAAYAHTSREPGYWQSRLGSG
ncbi:MAG: type II toxin-antitoxin system RelE/ParE family toxin [Propionibacteriaceae bacterium]|nr:type II toxin-antitoxin system RelE/ParE family toxin [Propionibacteriaceae bacterium]